MGLCSALTSSAQSLPTVTSLAPSGQSNAVATLNGTVNPNGSATTAWFEWGLTANSYSNRTSASSLGSGSVAVAVNRALSGLTPGLIYHGRLVGSNIAGIEYGRDVRFGSPALTLLGPVETNSVVGGTFTDPGATAWGALQAVASGAAHNLALKSDGTVVAWGDDSSGATNIPTGLSDVVAVAAGFDHSLALRSDGVVVAWGEPSSGQTNVPGGLANVMAVAGGEAFSLALKSDGTVVGWGDGTFGQTNPPTGLSNVVAVAAGRRHSLALKDDGTIAVWGNNAGAATNVPVGLSEVVAVAAARNNSLSLTRDGTVVAWGVNGSGQTNVPAGLSNGVAVACGESHSLALKSDGTVVAWGSNVAGETSVPVGLSNVVAVAGGVFHTLALQSDGTIVVWGDNSLGQTNVPGGLTTLGVATNSAVDVNTPGSYTITYSVTNALGGVNVATRTVVVQENAPPIVNDTLTNQTATYRTAFSFTFPTNAFIDPGGDTLGYSVSGLPPGITFTSATRTFAGTPTTVGSYTVRVIAGDGQTPELFATNSFTLTVGKAPLTITADDQYRTCGSANPTFTLSFAGFLGADTSTVLDTLPVAGTEANAVSGPGVYSITLTGGSDNHYDYTLVGGTLVITNGAPGSGTVRGTYHGLFYETNEVRYESSGAFLIKATAAGAYSGTLELAGGTLRISGTFPVGGAATNVIVRRDLPSVTVTLGYDDCVPPQAIFGTVSDGSWTAELMATPLHFHAKTNPAATAGRYVMTIPGFQGDVSLPTGHSWGTVTISTSGKLKLAGALADGTKLTEGSFLNEAGLWPFYVPYARNGGALLGWISVVDETAFEGELAWIRKAQVPPAKFYAAGFTNTTIAIGSRHTHPDRGTNVFTWTDGVALAGGGNLSGTLSNQFNLGLANRVTWLGTNFTSLTFNPKDGRFKGKVQHDVTGKPAIFNGVIHRGLGVGAGYFLGTNQSGSVTLDEP